MSVHPVRDTMCREGMSCYDPWFLYPGHWHMCACHGARQVLDCGREKRVSCTNSCYHELHSIDVIFIGTQGDTMAAARLTEGMWRAQRHLRVTAFALKDTECAMFHAVSESFPVIPQLQVLLCTVCASYQQILAHLSAKMQAATMPLAARGPS